MIMSSMVEIGQPVTSGFNEVAPPDRRDDVFRPLNKENQIMDLSNKFGKMQTSECSQTSVTDLPCSVGSVVSCKERKVAGVIPRELQGHQQSLYSGQIRSEANVTASRTDTFQPSMSASCTLYANQTASDTLLEGIRTSVRQILYDVPRIIINSIPDHHATRSFYDLMKTHDTPCRSYSAQHGKVVERHRQKDYFRPYCLLSRRRYSCQRLTIRRRKYGVSHDQKICAESGVNELTQLLEKLGTSDEKTVAASSVHNAQQKCHYSASPNYYMTGCRASTKLAEIKERSPSLSLSDLGVQGLCIGTATSSSTPPSYQLNSVVLNSADISKGNETRVGTSGGQISCVVSGLNQLNMSG